MQVLRYKVTFKLCLYVWLQNLNDVFRLVCFQNKKFFMFKIRFHAVTLLKLKTELKINSVFTLLLRINRLECDSNSQFIKRLTLSLICPGFTCLSVILQLYLQ